MNRLDLATKRLGEHIDGLQKALEVGGGTHSIMDVLDQISRGDAQLWTDPDAVVVTEVHDAPQCRELRFWLATGKLDAVLAIQHRIIEWGRSVGCTKAVLTGRRGWTKALRDQGWEEIMVVMGREI